MEGVLHFIYVILSSEFYVQIFYTTIHSSVAYDMNDFWHGIFYNAVWTHFVSSPFIIRTVCIPRVFSVVQTGYTISKSFLCCKLQLFDSHSITLNAEDLVLCQYIQLQMLECIDFHCVASSSAACLGY